MEDGEEAVAGEGGQKDCKPWWEVELGRDCEEGEEEGVMLPLLLMQPDLALLLDNP